MFTVGPETLIPAVFVVAALYGSVGHGGASGYLAVLSLAGVGALQASTTALMLNLFVAGIALLSYQRAGYFSWRLLLPLLLTSVPCAFLGGLLKVSVPFYHLLLSLALLFAAFRMVVPGLQQKTECAAVPSLSINLLIGAALGFISGVVGVGGGIFLSPLMIMLGWATPKETSATSAGFIVANSLAGLAGRLAQGSLPLEGFWSLLGAGVLGGLLGSYYGARRAENTTLCRLLALVLVIAAGKMLLKLL